MLVLASLMIKMIQYVIEILQIATQCVFPVDLTDFIICRIKLPRKTSEEFRHGTMAQSSGNPAKRINKYSHFIKKPVPQKPEPLSLASFSSISK